MCNGKEIQLASLQKKIESLVYDKDLLIEYEQKLGQDKELRELILTM